MLFLPYHSGVYLAALCHPGKGGAVRKGFVMEPCVGGRAVACLVFG